MLSFRKIVESEMSTRESRGFLINTVDKYGLGLFTNMDMSYDKTNTLTISKGYETTIAEIINYVNSVAIIKTPESEVGMGDGKDVKIKISIPIYTKFEYSLNSENPDKEELGIDKPILTQKSKSKIVEVFIDGKSIKLDKKTRETLVKKFTNTKVKGYPIKDFAKGRIDKETVFKFPEVSKAFEKDRAKFLKVKGNERLDKEKSKAKIIKKILKKENTSINKLALHSEFKYVVFNDKQNIEDLTRAEGYLYYYDANVWARDFDYKKGIEENKRIIDALSDIGSGTFVFLQANFNGPSEEVRISI